MTAYAPPISPFKGVITELAKSTGLRNFQLSMSKMAQPNRYTYANGLWVGNTNINPTITESDADGRPTKATFSVADTTTGFLSYQFTAHDTLGGFPDFVTTDQYLLG